MLAQEKVVEIPRLRQQEQALIIRLFKKIRGREQRYIHGKYLDPVTLTYEGEDPHGECISDTVTFLCFPFFELSPPYAPESKWDDHSHPVRSLLQTRSRLVSTLQRDGNQIIHRLNGNAQSTSLHVPQLWALVVNKGAFQLILSR